MPPAVLHPLSATVVTRRALGSRFVTNEAPEQTASDGAPVRVTPRRSGRGRQWGLPAVLAVVLAAATMVALGCGAGGGEVAQTGAGTTVVVEAVDNTFRPEVIEIEPGTEVVWTNKGRNNHDVVPTSDGQDWGIALSDFTPDTTYSHVFTEPGEYPYYCSVHATKTRGMIGTVIVKG